MPTTADLDGLSTRSLGRHGATPAAAILVGGALATWALTSPRFLDAAGYPSARLLLPLTAGLALGLLAATARTTFRDAAAWFALLLVGQAAALRLVVAGPSLHYQHYTRWRELAGTEPLAATVLVAQILIVGVGMAFRYRALLEWGRRYVGWWRGFLLAVAVALTSATLSAEPRAYLGELILATIAQATAAATIMLAAAALPWSATAVLADRLDRVLGSDVETRRPQVDRFALCCGLVVTIVTAVLCVLVYQRHPHVQDEVKYLFQSRYYAAGQLAMAVPPVPEAFELYLMEVGQRGWFSVIPPGWALVLASGQLVSAPWLVNPLLAGANILLAYIVLWHLYERRTARLALLLLSASPWYLYLGMSFMPHVVTLTCFLIGTLSVIHARATGAWYSTWFGGAAVGFLSLVRQLDGFVVAILLGLWSIGIGARRLKVTAIAGLVVSTAVVAGLTLPYNHYFTGEAAKFPIMAHNDRLFGVNANAYGFGPDRGMGWGIDPFPGHGPLDGLVNANLNATTMNVEMFGWATGSLIFVYFLFATGRPRGGDWLFVALTIAIFGAYFFNYFSGGPDFGPRYWFLMIVPGVVLTTRGIQTLAESLAEPARHAAARVTSAALALSASALLVFVPWRALDKYHHYLDMRPDIRRLAADHEFGRSLVLVRGPEFPDYASAAIYNPLNLQADAPVYAHDRGAHIRTRLIEAYPDRPVWIVDGPSVTRAGYRVVRGPIIGAEILGGAESP